MLIEGDMDYIHRDFSGGAVTMSITPIIIDQHRRIEDHDGLILQGCGGSLQKWQDGINRVQTEIVILKNGSRFENIFVFRHEGRTCLLFPFSDDLQSNTQKLAIL